MGFFGRRLSPTERVELEMAKSRAMKRDLMEKKARWEEKKEVQQTKSDIRELKRETRRMKYAPLKEKAQATGKLFKGFASLIPTPSVRTGSRIKRRSKVKRIGRKRRTGFTPFQVGSNSPFSVNSTSPYAIKKRKGKQFWEL